MILIDLAPLDRMALFVAICLLLLAAGLLRSWSLCHSVRARQAEIETRTIDQVRRIEDLQRRLDHVEGFTSAQEEDARSQHDDSVAEVLGSLLDLNESLRHSTGPEKRGGPRTRRARSGEAL